jgi:aminoglycoside phosphotransferase (APT) family kinase protein
MATKRPPVPSPSPEGLDLSALSTYLRSALEGGLVGPLEARLIAGGRSNPTYELSDGYRSWVLRRPPLGGVLQSTHDMMRESRVLTALHHSAVPVATVVASCPDESVLGAPFYVMDKIEGRTLRTFDDTASLSSDERAALSQSMVDTLVTLHQIDPDEVNLSDFGRPAGYLERQLKRWVRQWDQVATREGQQVSELARRLEKSMPELRFPGIVHGDYKIDNLMLAPDDPSRILALLDWEMATLGDTLADLGQLISFWDEPEGLHNPITAGATAHPGFPLASEIVGVYAAQRKIKVEDIDWYIVFADFKLAVILEQIHSRHVAGHTVGEGFDDIGSMVVPLLDRALERASASSDPRLRS